MPMKPYNPRQIPLDFDSCRDLDVPFEPADHVSVEQAGSLSLPALLAVALRPLSLDVCRRILDTHDWQLRHLAGAGSAELRSLGLTPKTIDRLRAIIEIAKRYGQEEFVPGALFRGSYDVYAHFREHLADETVEKFFVLLLDNKNRLLRIVLASLGSLTSSVVHPREIYRPVIKEAAAAVIFCHNHPSGDPTPSKEDIEITRRLREVGDLVGVRVLDHVVIGKGRYVSFVDDGYW
jgi:DNA repair protein RadC